VPRWPRAIAVVLMMLPPTSALASRAALDGRGLPRFLALDPSNDVSFPGSAARFDPQLLLDYPGFGLGMMGRTLRFGYVLDGGSHNLILAHPSGWGMALGISDQYDETQRSDYRNEDQGPLITNTYDKSSRRDVRLNLGWSALSESGRSYEVTLGGSIIDAEESSSGTRFFEGVTDSFSYAWTSGPGTQFALRLRTVSPNNGLLLAIDSYYEDLHPEAEDGSTPEFVRRYAASQLGFRLGMEELDDLVIGIRLQWNHDTMNAVPYTTSTSVSISGRDASNYFGGVFASAERHVVGALVARGGVQGSAHFNKLTTTRLFRSTQSNTSSTSTESQGEIDSPSFFLGAGWQFKEFTLDARINQDISLTYFLYQWSIGYSW
jgi:hypothetical protein